MPGTFWSREEIIAVIQQVRNEIRVREIEEGLLAYETDVRFPDVSGMEHLDMLITRSKIASYQDSLTEEQRIRLAEADRVLLQQASQFYKAIALIADITKWREHAQAPSSQWWWYLDVLAHAPLASVRPLAAQKIP